MFNDNGSLLIALFEIFLFFAWFMCLFWIFGDIFRSHDMGGVAKTLWVLLIIFTFWLGMLIYLIVRGSGMHERALEQQKQIQAAQAEYVKSIVGAPGGTSVDQITAAKKLLDEGTITQAEFDQMKAKALA
ncbi:MAG: SHOCT domain-containing protein [Candidatus Nanopelagicales bacterium]